MRKLGISLYPEKSSPQQLEEYIDKAAQAGFSRIFSCLLSIEDEVGKIKSDFIRVNSYAKAKGFEVFVDVSPRVFDKLGISYQNLQFFKDIEADGIRLDAGFTGNEEALMTYNPQGLKIEINMSNDTHYIDTIMDYQPNVYNLVGCHNFYPHRYSGLSLEHFNACSANFKKYGLRTAAFVTSTNSEAFGPWPVSEGLPSLEMHRDLPLGVQVKHLIALGNIDDIIISNCFPTMQEFNDIAGIRLDLVSFKVNLVPEIPKIEEKIVLEELHFNRGDFNEGMIRSTQSRVKYKGHDFKIFNAPEMIRREDVIIESSLYGHYAGELQIAKQDMKNSGKTNVVGRIADEELFLIDYIKPWQKFTFVEAGE
ncbi:MAG: MupG family TIM beta-alpha barrel fold protein [Erysipelotrichaceae bacterium]|nr:MupG family TIM beta-alpha barrel fold protein [Erysipelotrichaceae bacterium]